jgi:sugar lactone lactonase YvrE
MNVDNYTDRGVFIEDVSSTLNGLTLDLNFGARNAYITDPGKDGQLDGRIYRVNLDGIVVVTDMTSVIGKQNLRDPEGIALDLWRERIYWTDSGNTSVMDGKVYRCDMDGSGAQVRARSRVRLNQRHAKKLYALFSLRSGYTFIQFD